MKQEYKENETTLEEAKALAVKVLAKTLDMTKLTPEKGKTVLNISNNIAKLVFRVNKY